MLAHPTLPHRCRAPGEVLTPRRGPAPALLPRPRTRNTRTRTRWRGARSMPVWSAPRVSHQLTTGQLDTLGLAISGYVQAQYENSQLSEDQLGKGGLPLNRDRFLIRRATQSTEWSIASTSSAGVDGNTAARPRVRHSSRGGVARLSQPATQERRLTLGSAGGLSEIPFGYELTESSRNRVFCERSTRSSNSFSEPDVGVRVL